MHILYQDGFINQIPAGAEISMIKEVLHGKPGRSPDSVQDFNLPG